MDARLGVFDDGEWEQAVYVILHYITYTYETKILGQSYYTEGLVPTRLLPLQISWGGSATVCSCCYAANVTAKRLSTYQEIKL